MAPAALRRERVHEQRGRALVNGPLGEQSSKADPSRVGVTLSYLCVGQVDNGLDREVSQPRRDGRRHRSNDCRLCAGTGAPQSRSFAEQGCRGDRVAGAQAIPAGGSELLEPQRVDIDGIDVQAVMAHGLRDAVGRAENAA